eukprot:TRINITY_DN11501_c0_g1_i2.p2 TRINITY_DN11501_c0_g1~~TRINITY_DN11501_c0_g1_i2.p2  ORF type:complete len:305 (-),score=38.23 TRINITY_DN11501_c0_g1_i2:1177-2091(-)
MRGEIKTTDEKISAHQTNVNLVSFNLPSMAERLEEKVVTSSSSSLTTFAQDPHVEDIQPSSKVDNFEPIELKVPLQFKLLGYTTHPLPDHPLLVAHVNEPLDTFPPGDNHSTEKDKRPPMESIRNFNFIQPSIASAEHFPIYPHALLPPLPIELYPYHKPQNEDAAGAVTPFFNYDFSGSQALPPATPSLATTASRVLHDPLPKPIIKANPDDMLSDTDDDDAGEGTLPDPHPQSLADVASIFGGLGDHFLVTNIETEDLTKLIDVKPPNLFAQESLNDLDMQRVAKMYEKVEACLPPHQVKVF